MVQGGRICSLILEVKGLRPGSDALGSSSELFAWRGFTESLYPLL